MKTRIFLTIAVTIMIASCGTKKELAEAPIAIQSPAIQSPAGIEVMDTTTKVFASINLPKNDNWLIKNKEATWRPDEFLVKKTTPNNYLISIISTMSFGKFSTDLNDITAVVESIDDNADMLLMYNNYNFKLDAEGKRTDIPPPHTSKLDTLENGYVVVIIEAEVKRTNEKSKSFGNSYYARHYYYLAKKDENNCIPIISSSTLIKEENYETDKQKFIELVDYVVNTAVVNPEFKFKNQ